MKLMVLSLNAGSSSLKFAWHLVDEEAESLVASGSVADIDSPDATLTLSSASGDKLSQESVSSLRPPEAFDRVLQAAAKMGLPGPEAVGHRVVHAGPHYLGPQTLTRDVVDRLRALAPLAPLHLAPELDLIDLARLRYASLPQVACFDTTFFDDLPPAAKLQPIPRDLWDCGVRRYGFHGVSYESVVRALGPEIGARTVMAHLGGGSSLAALKEGRPVDTTMGMTPTGGLIMSTRSGDLDPGVLLYLLRVQGYTADRLDEVLNRESGLRAISGTTGNMRRLLELVPSDERAAEAVRAYCRQAAKFIGAMAVSLSGLDMLVFSGGVGQGAAAIREGICGRLEHLGVQIDPVANREGRDVLHSAQSVCEIRVVASDEQSVIARRTWETIRATQPDRLAV